jgi:HlyD family secretion protein
MNDVTEPIVLQTAELPVAKRAVVPERNPAPETSLELRERVKKLRIGGPGENSGGGSKGSTLGRVAWLPWILCGVLALTWGSVAIRTYKSVPAGIGGTGGTGTVSAVSSSSAPASGSTSKSQEPAQAGSIQLEVKGYLVAARQISVSPIDVGGKVIELRGPSPKTGMPNMPFVEGALYQKGDVIAVLDAVAYQAQMAEAQASLASAEQRLAAAKQRLAGQKPESVRKVEVDQAEAQLGEAQATRSRADQELRRLESIGSSSIGLRELQQAQADSLTSRARVKNLEASLTLLKEGPRKETIAAAEADVKGAEADVSVANARLAQAQWRLDNCTIKAPISGTVLTKSAEVGKLVNPMAFSGGGAICDLSDLSDLEVDLEIPEKDISKLKVGLPCTIRADAFSDKLYRGQLDRIMPIANRAKNIVNVRVKVKLPEGEVPGTYLKPEMGAVVSFRNETSAVAEKK